MEVIKNMKEKNSRKTEEKVPKRTKMQKKNSKISKAIIILLIIILAIIGIVFLVKNSSKEDEQNQNNETTTRPSYVEEIDSGVKINKSTKLNEAKEVSGYQITNIQLTTESGMTTLLADVTNNTGNKTGVQMVDITLLDEEGKELTTVTGIIDELEAGEKTQLNIAMTSDYINAYDFRVNLK